MKMAYEFMVSKETGFTRYLTNPYHISIPDGDTRLYKFISLNSVPSARNLKLVKQAVKKLGQNNPEEL
jgi:hypothetical protein